MDLGELLHELRINILHDRSHRVDGSEDQLWSDATLIRYIDEAQQRLAAMGLVIRDGRTPQTCIVELTAGQAQYDLHPSVIAVISARREPDTADLMRTGHAALGNINQAPAQFIDPSPFTSLPPGKPIAYTTDEDMGQSDRGSMGIMSMRLYPLPTEDYLEPVHLRVVRLPIHRLTPENVRATPEVPEEHHLEMLDWAAYLALRIADVDAGMPRRAEEFRQSFMATVDRARRASMRKLFAPKPWGFGRSGFGWER